MINNFNHCKWVDYCTFLWYIICMLHCMPTTQSTFPSITLYLPILPLLPPLPSTIILFFLFSFCIYEFLFLYFSYCSCSLFRDIYFYVKYADKFLSVR